ncbi:N-formylglutamate amidohydrolase [Candidatus Phycosocius spiralis]|uniref:N-formylglutamate amidohydrolase n=1 Tax=Candidatus Phycosocius spiralis TaxID=2815099 RepID=A0ABQ4PX75_9PROT|nr:N-formylglutamate amidohydrolase [Candidatus Phycosocius spiralis]
MVTCPHSGRFYPKDLLDAACLDRLALRRSEDAFVDELFLDAPLAGAYWLTTDYARAFVDLNRDCEELDPALVIDLPPEKSGFSSPRVEAGLGVIPRTVGDGIAIYAKSLTYQEIQARLCQVYVPWYDALDELLARIMAQVGHFLLLDCHSMPSAASGIPRYDIVLGDRYGVSCDPIFIEEADRFLSDLGFKVARNYPFAGGYSIHRYGHPTLMRHALQIEINRSLYMVEGALIKKSVFSDLRRMFGEFVGHLSAFSRLLIP